VRVTECVSELGRWDEAERAADLRLRRYVHGYFATSSSLVRLARERHLPAAEVPMVLNFGAPHAQVDAGSSRCAQRLDGAWVTGLQTRYHLSEATGQRSFMVVRFTPLGAHLFLRTAMDALTGQTVLLGQVDPALAALVSSHVMAARGWAQRFDAIERLIGRRVAPDAAPAAPPGIEQAWDRLARAGGQARAESLAAAAGCSQRHLIQQFRRCFGLPPKKAGMLLRFSRSVEALTFDALPGSARRPYLQGAVPLAGQDPALRLGDVAADCGYFDQPHFIREFTAFAGATPSEFVRGIPAARP
jgi:AraC-like DNA-binding protein